jgi:hypothetical protein
MRNVFDAGRYITWESEGGWALDYAQGIKNIKHRDVQSIGASVVLCTRADTGEAYVCVYTIILPYVCIPP